MDLDAKCDVVDEALDAFERELRDCLGSVADYRARVKAIRRRELSSVDQMLDFSEIEAFLASPKGNR